jgi:hypothetical protein
MPNFPTSLDALANPTATTLRNDPGFELHQAISTLNDIAEALEAKVGIGTSVAAAGTVLRGTGAGASAFGALTAADLAAGMGMRKLADTTLGAAAATVDFPNISQAYASLVIVGAASHTTGVFNVQARLSFDGTTFDATANYDTVYTNQTSTTTPGGGVIAAATEWVVGGAANFNSWPPFIFELPFYTVTGFYKAFHARGLAVASFAAGGYTLSTFSGQHRASTNPIRGLQLRVSSGQIVANSRFMLFGLPATLG